MLSIILSLAYDTVEAASAPVMANGPEQTGYPTKHQHLDCRVRATIHCRRHTKEKRTQRVVEFGATNPEFYICIETLAKKKKNTHGC